MVCVVETQYFNLIFSIIPHPAAFCNTPGVFVDILPRRRYNEIRLEEWVMKELFEKYGLEPYGAVPNGRHMEWYRRGKTAFLHFTVNTFTDMEWGDTEKRFPSI